ncbi:MAG: hypothetical protein ACR2MM_04195, partial [Flavobacteriaceae bacterium]
NLDWVPVSNINADYSPSYSEPGAGRALGECKSCSVFSVFAINREEGIFSLLGETQFDQPSSEQIFESTGVRQAFERVARIPGRIGDTARSMIQRFSAGSPPWSSHMTYVEMLSVTREFVLAFEDDFMQKWPAEKRVRPIPKPDYYSPFYPHYEKHLNRLKEPIDEVHSVLGLVIDLANEWV